MDWMNDGRGRTAPAKTADVMPEQEFMDRIIETVVRTRFRVEPTGGLSMQLRSSRFEAMTTVDSGEVVHAELDLGELGAAQARAIERSPSISCLA